MKLVKKQPTPDGQIIVTIVGDWNDGDYITKKASFPIEYTEQLLQRIVILQDFFDSRKELMWSKEGNNYIDIRTDYDEAAEEYLIHKYGFEKQEIRSKTVAASFYDEIYELAPSYEGYSIHTITSINIRIDGEEYEIEWEPSEVRGIIADLFSLES
jgi:hypothetical protein